MTWMDSRSVARVTGAPLITRTAESPRPIPQMVRSPNMSLRVANSEAVTVQSRVAGFRTIGPTVPRRVLARIWLYTTYGSCHSRCESNVQTCVNPRISAWRANSTIRHAGGSFCRTTPNSTEASDQVLGKAALHELAVALRADVAALVLHDGAARQHDIHVPVDLVALPGRVVHVHVVRLAESDRRVTVRVVDHDVGVGTRGDDALPAVEAEHPRRRGAADVHPLLQRDPAVVDALVQEVHPVLDRTDAVRDLREVADPHLLLVLHAERAVIGRHGGDVAGADVLPQLVLVPLGPRPQRSRADPLRALEARGAEVLLEGEVEVLRAGLAEDVLPGVAGLGDAGEGLLGRHVHD